MANEALYDEELETCADDYEESSRAYDAYADDEEQPTGDARWQQPDQYQQDFASAESSPLDAIDQLPMALTLRCGSLNLTLGDLRRVAAGTVLEVSGVTPGFATLCHGERVVAEGELVDVDGRLGLQITRMAPPA
ncbi:FliM/FliN family flagellar motor switch protein [Pseudomonas bohemica]|uniref:FliM/FliN family flagellar motor switch protein n=1 Tax=Pseudomonas bohemica TaxID=2044872 RepID=UPI000DA5FD9A|nr:FliM/FliN family flagellar motor switch protein [Pseudomonas bohemica]